MVRKPLMLIVFVWALRANESVDLAHNIYNLVSYYTDTHLEVIDDFFKALRGNERSEDTSLDTGHPEIAEESVKDIYVPQPQLKSKIITTHIVDCNGALIDIQYDTIYYYEYPED